MTNLLIKLFVKQGKNSNKKALRKLYGTLGSYVGIFCNFFLGFLKILIGIITSSISVTADGLNNMSDIGSSVITLIGFRLSDKPADREHPFGHGRMEYVSAFTVSLIILTVGAELLISSVKKLFSGNLPDNKPWYLFAILVFSILLKLWLSFFNRKLSKKIDSSALLAAAKDSESDCISTLAVLISAVIVRFIKVPFDLDSLMAALVSLFIIKSGISSAKGVLDEILGKPPEEETVKELECEIMKFDGFLGVHDLLIHDYGPGRKFASVHVEVPQEADIVSTHEKIDLCERLVTEKTGINLVIHMDPVDTNDENVKRAKSQLIKVIHSIDKRLDLHDFRMTPSSKLRTNLIFDVVVPQDFEMSKKELISTINAGAKACDPSFHCIVTLDRDFTGKL